MSTGNKIQTSGESKVKKQYAPIVFVNNPVRDPEHDVIGFNAQVETLQDAIDGGATMIGVIADYGTGKSSMTELLCNSFIKKGHPNPIKINMWDSLTEVDLKDNAAGISNLTRSFLFQLANGKSATFSSYINKLLSKNYGNISFASSSPWRFGIFAIIAGFFFGVYMMSTASGTGVVTQLPGWIQTIIPFIKALSSWFLVLAIAFLLVGLINLSIVFSHWKMPSQRKVEINDVFDVYRIIAKKLTPACRKKKRLVFVDDLDRINEKKIIVAFLKELYRFQDSITKHKDRIVFIISVKPESELLNNYTQDMYQTAVDTGPIYPKVFDTTIFLKPIHFDDYDSILLRLIKSAPKKKKALEELIGKEVDKSLPYSFRWIKLGTNLTLRDLKDRLNHAVAIMVSLKNKAYENNSAASFEACTAVAYLESQYPNDYYRLIKNEEAFAKFIKASYTIVNEMKIEEDAEELIKKFAVCFQKEQYTGQFIKTLCGMVMEKLFKDDFRMYFYTYPKDSHIKTTEEREICNCLLFPKQYSIPTTLDECVKMAYKTGTNDIIAQTLMPLESFPPIVIENEILLNQAVEVSIDKAFAAFAQRVITVKNSPNDLSKYWARIVGIQGENKRAFIALCINKVAAIKTPETIIQKRLEIIKGLGKNVLLFKNLFDGIEGVPQITKEEVAEIADPQTYIPLISVEAIVSDQYEYLCAAINSSRCDWEIDVWDKAVDIMKVLMRIIEPDKIGGEILRFLRNNRYLDNEMFTVVCSANISHDKIAEYINEFEPDELSQEYLELVDRVGFSSYIKEDLVFCMMKHALFFTPIMFYVKNNKNLHDINRFLGDGFTVKKACAQVNKVDPEIVVAFRRHCLQIKAMRFLDLFFEEYPLITVDEYKTFEEVSDAIVHINTAAINEGNVLLLLQVIYSRLYTPEKLVELFEHLFKADVNINCIDDVSTIKAIIDNIDFDQLDVKQLSYEQRSRLYRAFSNRYSVNDVGDAIKFTKRFGCFVPEVELIISSDNNASSNYCELIAEVDELSEIALSWLENNYFTVAASEKICNAMYESEWYTDYIVASMLREKKMVIDDKIKFSSYINAYAHVAEVFEIMSDHWDFLEQLQEQVDFSSLTEEQIIPMFKVPQTERFFEYMLSDKTTLAFKKLYLREFRKFKTEKDSIAFQRLICNSKNIKLVDSIELKESISHRLWDSNRSHKGQFTKAWNKEWASKLSQHQLV